MFVNSLLIFDILSGTGSPAINTWRARI